MILVVKMPTVSSCCGLKLRTGALLIGYFEVIISFIGVVLSSLLIFYMDKLDNVALYRNVSMIGITVSIQTLIVGLFLTNGVRKTDRSQIQPWVVIKGIMLCFEFGVILLTIWIICLENSRGHEILIFLVALAVEICVTGEWDMLFQSNLSNYEMYSRCYLFFHDCCEIVLSDNTKISSRRIILLIVLTRSFFELFLYMYSGCNKKDVFCYNLICLMFASPQPILSKSSKYKGTFNSLNQLYACNS